jgi:GNAT superfamily N-acetyltransferase
MKFQLRTALLTDCNSIETLIAASIRKLGAQNYSSEQIEAALVSAFGLDTQLIDDQTYFIVESDQVPVACGGWSFRATLFGNDAEQSRNPQRIDPQTGAAKIRAFFVNPKYSRMGIGSMIMQHCEREALSAGFRRLELMATLPGIKLYEKHGFVAGEPIQYPLGDRLTIKFVPMTKGISATE